MNSKRLFVLMLVVSSLILNGCSCKTLTSWKGGNYDEECLDHWAFRPKEPAKEPVVAQRNPCAGPSMVKSARSYPSGGMEGNAIRLEKMVPEKIRANEAFEYRIKVTNLIDEPLSNVVVTDQIPQNLKIEKSNPQMQKSSGGKIQWAVGTLEAGASKMITASAIASGIGSIASCADVFYDSPTCAKMEIVEPKLVVEKVAPSESLSCDRIPLHYVVTNTGTGYACNIALKDELGQGLKTADGKRMVAFSLDSLGPGESKKFTQTVDATSPGIYSSKATVVSQGSGTAQSNMATTRVTKPVLTINKSCPSEKYIGRNMTFDISVANEGNANANDTIVEATIPEHANFESATSGGVFTHSSPGKVTWNLGTLKPNASRDISVTVSTNLEGTVKSTTTARAYCTKTATATCETMLSGISAVLMEVVDLSDPVEIGRETSYIISVTNQGSSADSNVRIQCHLEDNMTYVTSSGPTVASVIGNKISFAALPSLAPKAKAIWRVTVKAIKPGDVRFKATMNTDQLGRSVEETEATKLYE